MLRNCFKHSLFLTGAACIKIDPCSRLRLLTDALRRCTRKTASYDAGAGRWKSCLLSSPNRAFSPCFVLAIADFRIGFRRATFGFKIVASALGPRSFSGERCRPGRPSAFAALDRSRLCLAPPKVWQRSALGAFRAEYRSPKN